MSVLILLKVAVAAASAAVRPADPGGLLLAGFLKELGRSNGISLKPIPGSSLLLWIAGIHGCSVVVPCCVAVLGSSGVPRWSHPVLLGNLIPTSPSALAAPPAAPTSWEGSAPASEPVARMAGCVQGHRGTGLS